MTYKYMAIFYCFNATLLWSTTASEIIMCMGVLILSLQHSSFLMSHYENKRLRTFCGVSESLTGSCPYCIVSTHLFSVTIYKHLITAQNHFHVDGSIPNLTLLWLSYYDIERNYEYFKIYISESD